MIFKTQNSVVSGIVAIVCVDQVKDPGEKVMQLLSPKCQHMDAGGSDNDKGRPSKVLHRSLATHHSGKTRLCSSASSIQPSRKKVGASHAT